MSVRTRLVAATLIAGVAVGVLAAPVAAAPRVATPRGLTVRLLDEPTALRKDPRASVYVIDELRPGMTITRHVEVSNNTGQATDVSLYPAAATIAGGGFAIETGQAANQLTGWTRITPAVMPLASGASGVATVTIEVPTDATSGEGYEGLVAALPPLPTTGGLALENRVAIRVYLAVSSARAPLPASNFTIGSLQARRLSDGTPQVTATVTNTGGRALDLTGTLRLTDGPGGLSAGPYDTSGESTLAVAGSGQVSVRLAKAIPAGPWTARITVVSGLLTRVASATITFPSAAGTAAPPVRAHTVPLTKNRSVLIPVAGGLIGLVAIGLLLVARRRRRRDEESAAEPVAAEPVGAGLR
jgi:hypothetical protein